MDSPPMALSLPPVTERLLSSFSSTPSENAQSAEVALPPVKVVVPPSTLILPFAERATE